MGPNGSSDWSAAAWRSVHDEQTLDGDEEPLNRVVKLLVLSAVASVASVGNVFVISAVLMEEHLKKRGEPAGDAVGVALCTLAVLSAFFTRPQYRRHNKRKRSASCVEKETLRCIFTLLVTVKGPLVSFLWMMAPTSAMTDEGIDQRCFHHSLFISRCSVNQRPFAAGCVRCPRESDVKDEHQRREGALFILSISCTHACIAQVTCSWSTWHSPIWR